MADCFVPKTDVALHVRKFADGDDVPLADLEAALITAARAVTIDEIYLPIFLRIEREIQERRSRAAILQRVTSLVSPPQPAA